MRAISEIIIHCTATRPDWWGSRSTKQKVAEIRRWHTTAPRNWSDIGYHFLIDRNGTVAKGRPIERDGAHVRGRNKGTIGIALFGGHGSAETDSFGEHFTGDQAVALRKLIADLRREYGFVPVTGHNQWAAKACPGFNVPQWLRVIGQEAPKPAPVRPQKPATPPPVAPDRPKGLAALLSALWGLFRKEKA